MSKILYVTAFVPGRSGAGENFSRQFINDISNRNFVDLVYFKYHRDEDYNIESDSVTVLKVYRNSRLIKILNFLMFPFIFPLFSVRFNLLRLIFIKKAIRKRKYDLVVFDFSQTFLFAKFLKGVPVLLNCHDIIAQRYSRIYYGILAPFVRISEKFVLGNKLAKIFCLSEKDSRLIMRLYNIESTATSIFLDNSVLVSNPTFMDNYYVFFGNWNRPDNSEGLKWFLKNVYPYLEEDFNATIIGSGLPAGILSLIDNNPCLKYPGFISDPYPIISNSRALISPLFTGAGIKVKVLESLACGTPVIGTDISFEGVSEKYSRYLFYANTAKEFIESISNFNISLQNKLELKRLFISSYFNNSISAWVNEPNDLANNTLDNK